MSSSKGDQDEDVKFLTDYRHLAAARYHRFLTTCKLANSDKVTTESRDVVFPRKMIPGLSEYIAQQEELFLSLNGDTQDIDKSESCGVKGGWKGYIGELCEGCCGEWGNVMGVGAEKWRISWEKRGGGSEREKQGESLVMGSGILGRGVFIGGEEDDRGWKGWRVVRRKQWELWVSNGGDNGSEKRKQWEGVIVLGNGNEERGAFQRGRQGWVAEYVQCLKMRMETGINASDNGKGGRDTYDEVWKRYCSRPHELYRRRASKKFAAYRRKCENEERKAKEMRNKRRARNMDRLMSAEDKGKDSKTVGTPFLFANENVIWMYCDGWGAEGRRRKMIKRYVEMDDKDIDDKLERLEKAKNIAESAPMFHTKVMNPFI